MKKFVLLILLCFFSLCAFSKELAIMSFNIQGHGPGSSEHSFDNAKYRNQIASIINQSDAGIVLLQEVRMKSDKDIQPLLNALNRKSGRWQAASSVKYYDCSSDLNNAVLYNEKYVKLIDDYAKKLNFLAYKFDRNNGVSEDCRKYQFDKNHEQVLEFEFLKNPSQTFFVVNVHAPGPDSENLKAEIEQIEKIYRYYKRKNIVIGGDFNTRRKKLYPSSAFGDAVVDGDSEKFADFQGLKTTVSSSGNNITLANDYDHFIARGNSLFTIKEPMRHIFSAKRKDSYDSIKIGGTVYKSADEYRKNISDHFPIMIKLEF